MNNKNRMSIDDINAHLGANILEVLEWLEVDSDDFVQYGEGMRGPSCCHGGDNPSGFSFYEEKNVWFCWTAGCHNEHGADPIGLVASIKNITRKQAIPQSREFVESKLKDGTMNADLKPKKERKVEDHCQTHLEQTTFPASILGRLGSDLSYAEARGFDKGVMRRMGCGISHYGIMEGRLVFPVKNIKGEVVGFSGRQIVEDPNQPKWRHSRFKKSVNLLNIDMCKQALKRWDISTVVLTEGPWDVAKLCQAGFWNSMGVMGASITKGQMEIMKKMNITKVILFMDNDAGGRNHELQNVQKLERESFQVEVVYPKGEGQDVGDITVEEIKSTLRGKQ